MRRIYYDSLMAKMLLAKNFDTSMLFGTICTKHAETDPLSERVKRHESIHCEQYWEVTVAAFLVAVVLQIVFGGGWWFVAVPFVYYAIYFLEAAITWAIRLCTHGWREAFDRAYTNSMFEQEARDWESVPGYVESRPLWAVLHYFGRI